MLNEGLSDSQKTCRSKNKLFLLLLCPILLPPSPDPSGMHTETMKNWLRSSKRRLVSGLIRHCHHFCLEVPIIVVNKVLDIMVI